MIDKKREREGGGREGSQDTHILYVTVDVESIVIKRPIVFTQNKL